MPQDAERRRAGKRPPQPATGATEDPGTAPELVVRDDFVSWLEAEYEKARRDAPDR